MKKRKSNMFIINMISIYFFILFFYGILIKFTVWNPTLFMIKTYLPEVILIICIMFSIITKKIKFNYLIIIMLIYSFGILIINYLYNGANTQSFYWWRDLFIPLFTSLILIQREFDKEDIKDLLKKLTIVAKIFIIFGLILAVVEQVKGAEWTSKFYTGYSFYGQDAYSKVKIAHNMGLLRAPSITGNYSTFAYYSCFSLFLILLEKKSNFSKICWTILTICCCILSTNKSAILTLFIILIINNTAKMRSKNKIYNKLILMVSFATIGLMLLLNSDIIFQEENQYTGGFMQRFSFWGSIIKEVNLVQLIVPYNMFAYGSESNLLNSFFDNVYLYCFVTQGIIGSIIWIYYFRKMYLNLKIKYKDEIFNFIKNTFNFFIIIGLTCNVIQGRAYFCFMIILFSILYKFDYKNNNKKENIIEE